MIAIPTLSFCITCKNRIYQISRTLSKNLADNRLHSDWVEFVLVDFGSTDGLKDWILNTFRKDLSTGYLKYYYTDGLPYWHMSVAKNTAHWCANNEIVVNLDCDNFTGYLGGQFVIKHFLMNKEILFHQFSGVYGDGSHGRIAVLKKYFDAIGGYDELFEPMSYQDNDIIARLSCLGLTYMQISDIRYCQAISNTKAEGLKNTNSLNHYGVMFNTNSKQSKTNINNGCFIANKGKYGIRNYLYDHNNILIKPDSR